MSVETTDSGVDEEGDTQPKLMSWLTLAAAATNPWYARYQPDTFAAAPAIWPPCCRRAAAFAAAAAAGRRQAVGRRPARPAADREGAAAGALDVEGKRQHVAGLPVGRR